MRKIDATLSKIRLLLSEVAQREAAGRTLCDQYLAQRQRVLQASLYGDVDLSTIVGLLDDIERKIEDVERAGRHLALLRARAEQELRSLTLTRQAEDAKAELAVLQQRDLEIQAEVERLGDNGSRLAELLAEQARLAAEVTRLRALIAEASDLAARTFAAASSGPRPDETQR
ncbi:MAG TPA: hypothetical protein VHL09_06160 [Dehalococcoidia bacterium]|nr:hypothetical protein [Dehalococcoidia bacterium]